jgi:hypothetical protein
LLATACGSDALVGSDAGVPSSAQSGAGPDASAANAPSSAQDAFLDTKIVVTTSIALEVTELREAYVAIGELARGAGGFVAGGHVSEAGENGAASLRLRVPAGRHDDIVASLRGFAGAKVGREETNAKEVTEEFADIESRRRNLEFSEAQYQTLLGRAGSINEVLQVTAKIDSVRGEIEKVRGRLNVLSDITDFATINVALSVPPPAPAGSAIASPVRVLSDAIAASLVAAQAVLNIVVVLLVAAAWLIPSAIVVLVAWRRVGRNLVAFGSRLLSS